MLFDLFQNDRIGNTIRSFLPDSRMMTGLRASCSIGRALIVPPEKMTTIQAMQHGLACREPLFCCAALSVRADWSRHTIKNVMDLAMEKSCWTTCNRVITMGVFNRRPTSPPEAFALGRELATYIMRRAIRCDNEIIFYHCAQDWFKSTTPPPSCFNDLHAQISNRTRIYNHILTNISLYPLLGAWCATLYPNHPLVQKHTESLHFVATAIAMRLLRDWPLTSLKTWTVLNHFVYIDLFKQVLSCIKDSHIRHCMGIVIPFNYNMMLYRLQCFNNFISHTLNTTPPHKKRRLI